MKNHYIGDGCETLPDDHPLIKEHGFAALQSLAQTIHGNSRFNHKFAADLAACKETNS